MMSCCTKFLQAVRAGTQCCGTCIISLLVLSASMSKHMLGSCRPASLTRRGLYGWLVGQHMRHSVSTQLRLVLCPQATDDKTIDGIEPLLVPFPNNVEVYFHTLAPDDEGHLCLACTTW